MSKPKEINEKTFELNLTNELLNISKSIVWYLFYSPLSPIVPLNVYEHFLNQSILFAEGLSQKQESDPTSGGYDVSINFNNTRNGTGRLLFLQYKAGIRKNYCLNNKSKFYKSSHPTKDTNHISFKFNDAANNTQHSTLRNLASKPEIQSESVMYVFPRITEKTEFENKIGELIFNSSFVPVLDLDNQAAKNRITINDGTSHKYRTSYNGSLSEVNFFFFTYQYNKSIVSDLLAELISIQIERIFRVLKRYEKKWPNSILKRITPYADEEFIFLSELSHILEKYDLNIDSIVKKVNDYLIKVQTSDGSMIPNAPERFTSIIQKDGLNIKLDKEIDLSKIKYQIF